jgi:hypothetical protein
MPLTEKGEKIKGAMERQYGEEKGEKIFYASRNKGTISGVDSMTLRTRVDEIAIKADALTHRLDTFFKRRADRRKRMDEFEEAKHPRNSGGVFAPGGKEGGEKEEKEKTDADYAGAPVEVKTPIK